MQNILLEEKYKSTYMDNNTKNEKYKKSKYK